METPKKIAQLPHSAVVDNEQNIIHLPLGALTLHISFEEWEEFVSIINDVNVAFKNNLEGVVHECASCGSVNIDLQYIEPTDQDLN